MPGVVGLALITYTRGRTALRLHADRPADELALGDALQSVFSAHVQATQTASDEIAFTIGSSG